MRSGADRPAISTGPALMIPAGYPRDLPSALLRAARDFGGAGVVEIGPDGRETKLDFPTLLELAARILAGLRANGVRAGDPAVVHCTEPVGFFAAFWACTLGGIRPLLVAPNPGGDRTEEGRERLRRITDLLGWTVLIGRPSDLPNDLGLPVLDPDAMAGHEPTSDFHRPAADDVAVLMLSSGSTGTPKIVQLTHRGLVEFAAGTPAMLPVRPGQTTLNWLPLDRSGAFLLYHLLPVFTGCTNVHVNTDWVLANPLRWLDLMEQHRVNHSWSPNFGYRLATAAVAGEPDRHWDLSALRSLVSGGEQITVPVMSEFLRVTNRFGVVPETFVAAWGMTETVTGITFARPGLTPNVHRVRIPPTGVVEWVDQRPSSGKVAVARPGKPRTEVPGVLSLVSVGAPAPGTTVRIVAPNGAVLPEGRIGQLQVASARVTPGYLGNLEADRIAFPVGNWPARKWLATGDQGFITGGQLVITGRDSERIIMSGKLYYAHDIESVAATVVGAEQGLVAACGIADEETGTDRLVVFYALTADSVPGMDQAIRSLIQARLGLSAQVVGVPRRDFPTTPGGKILRPLLKQRWIDGTLLEPPTTHVEPAGATPASGPTGQGPSSTPESTPFADEDAAERTTELPVVRLAWKRELQQSIPTPPQRPTLGTPPPPSPDPTAPAPDPTPTASVEPTSTAPDREPTRTASDAEPTRTSSEAEPTPTASVEPTSTAPDREPTRTASDAEPTRTPSEAETTPTASVEPTSTASDPEPVRTAPADEVRTAPASAEGTAASAATSSASATGPVLGSTAPPPPAPDSPPATAPAPHVEQEPADEQSDTDEQQHDAATASVDVPDEEHTPSADEGSAELEDPAGRSEAEESYDAAVAGADVLDEDQTFSGDEDSTEQEQTTGRSEAEPSYDDAAVGTDVPDEDQTPSDDEQSADREPHDTANELGRTDPTDATDAVEMTEAAEPVEATSADATDAVDATDAMEAAEVVDAADAADASDAADAADASDAAEDVDAAGAADGADALESVGESAHSGSGDVVAEGTDSGEDAGFEGGVVASMSDDGSDEFVTDEVAAYSDDASQEARAGSDAETSDEKADLEQDETDADGASDEDADEAEADASASSEPALTSEAADTHEETTDSEAGTAEPAESTSTDIEKADKPAVTDTNGTATIAAAEVDADVEDADGEDADVEDADDEDADVEDAVGAGDARGDDSDDEIGADEGLADEASADEARAGESRVYEVFADGVVSEVGAGDVVGDESAVAAPEGALDAEPGEEQSAAGLVVVDVDGVESAGDVAADVVPEEAQDSAAAESTAVGARVGVVEPVAVVGVAGRFPGAEGVEQFWENLVGGVESLRRESGDGVVAVSGVLEHVESFDAKFFGLSDREAELMDPAQRLFLEVCHQALEHGGYAGTTNRVGVFAGSGMNLYNRQHQSRDSIATRVAYRLGLTGPAIGVQSASSSSLVAVHLACQALRSGDADLALAGAAAVQVPQATTYHPTPDSILSPSGQIRAFAADADGTVGGNGVAAVLLKRLDQALTDGDTVYAVIRGTAVSNEDAPAGNQTELIERALDRAGFDADSLSYIEAHGIGSPAADAAEVKALTTALRRHTDKVGFCTLGSVKPNIGHLDSAAGMAGLIKTILMLQHRMLVPTINVTEPSPELDLDGSPFVIGTEVREWTVPLLSGGTTLRAGVSALDPGGTNAHVILEEAPRQIRRGDDGPVVLPLSAPDPDALADLVELYRTDLGHGTGHRLIDLAGTAALGRPAHRHRIAVAGGTEAELVTALGSAQPTEVPRGGPGPLGYAFTGQGAARRGMAAGLAARFPVFRSVLDECDRVYHEETGGSLLELLLTPAGTAEGVWPTETAQPALFAFELALARLWQSFGVQPALVVGHSVGEYAALCVAGALSLADGVRLTAKRGELMQRGTVPGAMVAVRADADRVREIARTAGVEVAAGNGPQSFVLTGSEVIVGQLAAQLDQLQVAWQRLDVDRAFHSSLVDPILADFAEIVREITLKPLRTPMVSSWSGDLLESGTVLDSDYLVGQLRQPVLFGDAVEAVTAAGCRRFLELGPDAVLSPAGRRIAPNSTWIPAQRLGQDPVLATMNGLAELYEQGTEIAWAKVYADGGRVPLPTYPFRRVHHPVDPSVTVLAGPGTAVAGDNNAPRLNAFERAARAQAVVFEPPSSAAVKRIPLDPPEPVAAEPVEQAEESSPFALPAETHEIDADYLAQAGSLSGDEMSAERYRESLNVVLDLTCEVHNLDPYDLTVDHTFAELGATPASMAPVIDELKSRFEAELAPDDLFLTYTTPHKLATAVAVQTAEPVEAVEPVASQNEASLEQVAEKEQPVRDAREALAVLGSGLAELAAKVDEAAAATSEADLPGSGMAALMSQQLRVAGQLVDGVTKLMREQLALLGEPAAQTTEQTAEVEQVTEEEQTVPVNELRSDDEPAVEFRRTTMSPADVQRRDFIYWTQVLAGAEPLVLPADRARAAGDDAVASVQHELDKELGDAVLAYSRERKLSPVMTMLAAVATVLGRFAAQDDVTIGSALLGPKEIRPLPLRIDLSGEPDLGELTERIRDITAGAFDHAGTDLAILERDPLFQILVEFEDELADRDGDDLPPSVDLRFRLTQHDAGITCTADYRSGLFERPTIARLLDYLAEVLRRATTSPDLRLPELVLPIESDLEALRELESDADTSGPIGRLRRDAVVAGELSGLHTLFEQQVARTPDAIALIQDSRELTYAELDRRSNAVAWQLVDLGVKPGQLVAVRVARGTEMVVAVLAVLKAGAAYLPLDPGVPESRWAFMVQDAAAVALVGDDAALADRLGLRLVPVGGGDADTRARQAPPVRAAADDVAYCIYTSGSSGNPKGVVVPHRGPVNLVRHYLRTRRSLRTLQCTSFGFDVHVQEMFTTLASGAALVLIGEDDRYDPDAVVAALRDHGVQRLFMAFSPLTALLATMRRLPELPELREIVAGGEAMVLTHKVRDFLDAHPECRLFNEYGPAEASIVTTIHEVDPAEDRPSIGRPIDGVVVRLLDAALRPVPVGAVGEIHLGGAAVAQGYLGRPEETEHAFVADPGHPGARLYRSRDLGRWRADGTLEYLGRADDQVKIRGHRVEPGETEHVLADQPGVVDAVVVACSDPGGDTCLIGYVVLEDSDPAVLARLMLDLGKELPIYLVPADLIPIEELPLDDNGRLDRSRLPEPEWLKP
ncbi:amino acid adenylation domain-containing protein [Kribbella pratensis]|uniref:Amino acid adenylation domain-containing protein n=1 Tax=Kribbella pratensis TaxID=2512112 RepID=A0ABY2FNE6_9ACTN|nr:non-ribosomal peptide synthetase/type I polyketide synthase [Kribbella pratensis]TDW94406.1 amino acid adenylation domain-containing protein [Kribbella pratensis]